MSSKFVLTLGFQTLHADILESGKVFVAVAACGENAETESTLGVHTHTLLHTELYSNAGERALMAA